MYEIEKGVEIPETKSVGPGRSSKYPFGSMEVGDSFLIAKLTQPTVSSLVQGAKRRTGFKFTTRKVDGGVRVWRTA